MQFFKDWSVSTFSAGFVAVLVGFTSSVAIVFQAAQAFKATPAVMTSWMWAIGLGMGLCTVVPSLRWRKPVMVAWSTPDAAVLDSAGMAGGFSMSDAVGAFMMCAALIVLVGATGWFERLMDRIPVAIASALLAGVLARFGLSAFTAAQTNLALVVLMLLTYLSGKRWLPRYAVPMTLAVSIVFVAATHGFLNTEIQYGLTVPVWVTPAFSVSAFVSLALPLFIVTMASQNLPSVAAIRAAGYGDERARGGDGGIPISRTITRTGLCTLVLAPFSATIIGVLTAFPKELVSAIAGLALLGSIAGGLRVALDKDMDREAAIITFLVTLSGVTVAGVGSAFWGVVAGALALVVQHWKAPQTR